MSVSWFVLERDVQAHAVGGDFAVLHGDVEARRLRDSEIADGTGGGLDGVASSRFLRFGADADHLGDAVDAVAHLAAPLARILRSEAYNGASLRFCPALHK